MLIQRFFTLDQGIGSLVSVSSSAARALSEAQTEDRVRLELATNPNYRSLSEGIDTSSELYVCPLGVAYKTSDGLIFGWRFCLPANEASITGEKAPAFFVATGDDSLQAAFIAANWETLDPTYD